MIRLSSYAEWPADCTGQAFRSQDVRFWGNLAEADGEFFTTGDGAGGQVSLRDRVASRRRQIQDIGRDPFHCASYVHITHRSRNVCSSSLMCRTHSMRRTGHQLYGLSDMSGPAARSLPLNATFTGPLWWCAARRTGQDTSCVSSRV